MFAGVSAHTWYAGSPVQLRYVSFFVVTCGTTSWTYHLVMVPLNCSVLCLVRCAVLCVSVAGRWLCWQPLPMMLSWRGQNQQPLQHTAASWPAPLLLQLQGWLCTAWRPRHAAPGAGARAPVLAAGAAQLAGAAGGGAQGVVPAQGGAARRQSPGAGDLLPMTAAMRRLRQTLAMRTGAAQGLLPRHGCLTSAAVLTGTVMIRVCWSCSGCCCKVGFDWPDCWPVKAVGFDRAVFDVCAVLWCCVSDCIQACVVEAAMHSQQPGVARHTASVWGCSACV